MVVQGGQAQPLLNELPPHNVEAEKSVLGAMMLWPDVCEDMLATLAVHDFFLTDNQIIFDTIRSLRSEDRLVDVITVKDELEKRNVLAEVGGRDYLGQLLNVFEKSNTHSHARIIKEKSALRTIISKCTEATRQAYLGFIEPDALVQDVQKSLADIQVTDPHSTFNTMGDVMSQTLEWIERPQDERIIRTGMAPIDEILDGGLMQGEMCVIGGRPGMGKSTLMRQMAVLMASKGTPIAYFSTEEPDIKIGRNILSWLAQVQNKKFRRGELTSHDRELINDWAKKISKYPFYEKYGVFNVGKISAMIGKAVKEYGVRVVFIDYLQKLSPASAFKAGDRYSRVTATSEEVAQLKAAHGVALVVGAQLNRETAKGERRPTMADLKESGQIEQDADQVLLLHREDYYNKLDPDYEMTHISEVIGEKLRDCEPGTTALLQSRLSMQCFTRFNDGWIPPSKFSDPERFRW